MTEEIRILQDGRKAVEKERMRLGGDKRGAERVLRVLIKGNVRWHPFSRVMEMLMLRASLSSNSKRLCESEISRQQVKGTGIYYA